MNQDLLLGDTKYISVSRASKETGYTQDYLGQLCRAGKLSAKMIGRTWYVNREAVLAHKKNPTSRNKKNVAREDSEVKIFLQEILAEQTQSEYVSPFKFSSYHAPKLPTLKKEEHVHRLSAHPELHIARMSVVAIALIAAFSWLGVLSPRTAEIVMSAVKDDVSQLGLLTATHGVAASTPVSGPRAVAAGVVAFPDPADHNQAVTAVENSFSDPADVTFDQSGTSGVITPVFTNGTQSDRYAFVMVPVKPTK